jgi:hypothetical protein
LQTLPATLSAIVAVAAGVLAALLMAWLGAPMPITVALGTGGFVVSIAVFGFMTRHAFIRFVDRMPTQFPSPSPLLPARTTRGPQSAP